MVIIPATVGPITLTRSGSGEDGHDTGDLDVWDSAGGTLTIVGTSGTPVVRTVLPDRILHVISASVSPHVRLESLVIEDGTLHPTTSTAAGGGCVAHEGPASLTLVTTVLRYCRRVGLPATHAGVPVFRGGGAVYAGGPLDLQDSDLYQNVAEYAPGGGLYALSDLSVQGSLLEGNTVVVPSGMCGGCSQTYAGGGLWAGGTGDVDIFASTLRANLADRGGGANVDGVARFSLEESIVAYNEARGDAGGTGDGQGGGLWISADELQIRVTELAENEAKGGSASSYGGGAWVVAPRVAAAPMIDRTAWIKNVAVTGGGGLHVVSRSTASSTQEIRNTTFSENVASSALSSGGGGLSLVGGGGGSGLLTVDLQHSTFYGNLAWLGHQFQGVNITVGVLNSLFWGGSCSGTVTSGGGNSWTAVSCIGAALPSDRFASAPLDIPNSLGYYGGAITRLHSLPLTHRLLNAVPCSMAINEDQHGKVRPGGLACEPGAWEAP
jgi:hypothetical protein